MADYVAHPEFCTCQSCVVDRAYEVVVDDYKAALADRDRRIEALVAEVDSWKASYMALAPDHDIAMTHANSRIEALTKALHQMCKIADFMPDEVAELLHAEARKLLASAAGGGAK